MINAGERFLSAHINTGGDLSEVTESSSYCFQGSTTGVGALFRRCWVVDILLWSINHQWNGWNWKKENLGWWLLLSRQYNYCKNPYLRGKQEEMFSLRRKQLMLLGMNMPIYFASKMISRNFELDNVVDEERFTMAVETPLSPTLPNVERHKHHSYRIGDSQFFIEQENSMPCHLFGIMDLEVHYNNSSKMEAPSICLTSWIWRFTATTVQRWKPPVVLFVIYSHVECKIQILIEKQVESEESI